ncbi:MAG: chemotaxis protein [Candidatus Polarisedimenticolaceae bacterium]|nr:chemotaxis protein [Candidatus Polarisedimenticolaceae bacterium]
MAGSPVGNKDHKQREGESRLELLLFRLKGRQLFGINVFKVKEIIQRPTLSDIPGSHSVIRGSAHMRGQVIPVMDLCMAVGGPYMAVSEATSVIITECNRHVVGFLVGGVERIININWELVLPPPPGLGRSNYMTAVTTVDDVLVEIIDVEKVMSEVLGGDDSVSEEIIASTQMASQHFVLVVDDSEVARNQIKRALDQIGVEAIFTKDGLEALKQLQTWQSSGDGKYEHLAMVISDIEMPKMDGYTLVSKIRSDANLRDMYIILHSSLSGGFNRDMVENAGANKFLSKFEPDEFASLVQKRIKEHQIEQPQ